MSYAIQNFYNMNQKVHFNKRTYLTWIFRNLPIIIAYINKTNNIFMYLSIDKQFQIYNTHLFHTFFNNGFYKLCRKLTVTWRPLLGSNYIKSLEYWSCKLGIYLVESDIKVYKSIVVSQEYFLNIYLHPVLVSNIPLQNKYYRTVLIKFMYLLLLNWQVWKRVYDIAFRFTLITKDFYLIRCYNQPKFKIHHI